MKSLPNEEAKIEQLIRQLATISPPFVNSREELKRLAASIYLLADQTESEGVNDQKENAVIDLPPLSIPAVRPIFADHSNPVPDVSEESIEQELQWTPAPPAVPSAEPTPEPVAETHQSNLPPAVEQEPTTPLSIAQEPAADEKETQTAPEPADLFAQAAIPQETAELTKPVEQDNPVDLIPDTPVVQAPTMPEPIAPAPPIEEPAPVQPPAPTPESIQPPITSPVPPAPTPVNIPVDRDLQRALPLVRRLEFINRLFNGNDSEWQLFCQDVNRATSTADALQIYRECYIRYGWEKHGEMADLLKQLIVKTFG